MIRARRIAVLSTLLLPLAAAASCAEAVPPAVGRISYGETLKQGAAICTGVLVAPDLVLTAAHCVRGAAETPRSIRFDVGWSEGRPSARRRGAAVILTGPVEKPGLLGLSGDAALLRLDMALPAPEFPPLPVIAPDDVAPDDVPLTLFAFDRNASDQPPRIALCRSVAGPPGLLALDCPVQSGNSGAPLLLKTDGMWQLVAVMVASANDVRVRAWAVLPPPSLQTRIPLPEAGP